MSDPGKGTKDTLMDAMAAAGDPVDPEFFDDLVFDACDPDTFSEACDCFRVAWRRDADGITAGVCAFIGPIGDVLEDVLNTDFPTTIIGIIGELFSLLSPGTG